MGGKILGIGGQNGEKNKNGRKGKWGGVWEEEGGVVVGE